MKTGFITFRSYDRYCKSLRILLRAAEEGFHTNRLNSLGNNVKQNWRILNRLLGRTKAGISNNFVIDDQVIYDERIICEEFGKYFVENPRKIHREIPPSSTNFIDFIPRLENSIVFNSVSESEVNLSITKL